MPGTVLNTGNIAINKQTQSMFLMELIEKCLVVILMFDAFSLPGI